MPEHAAFSICDGGMLGGFDCFLYSEILMVGGKHFECLLAVHVEADKVFQDVKKTILFKQPFKKGVELSILGVLIASVRCFPLHKSIFAGSNGSCLGSSHVTHDADFIVNEHGRNLIHIVAKLAVCVGSVRLFTGRGFQFHYHKGQTIDKENHIRAFLGIFYESPLICNGKIVIGRIFEVNKVDKGGAFLAIFKVFDRHTILQIVGKSHILLQQ